jgi:polysaccharide export outer membrane protein
MALDGPRHRLLATHVDPVGISRAPLDFPPSMIHHRVAPILFGLTCLLPITSCTLVSESGPVKGTIKEDSSGAYSLVEVKTRADIPSVKRAGGLAEMPPRIKGQAYTDRVRARDSLQFIITDVSDKSPFASQSGYNFGPIEIPEDGKISLPYVGELDVLGKNLSEVSSAFTEKVKPVSNTAQVSVNRTGRVPRTANVIGEVKSPGPVPLERTGITSLDILASAGGPTGQEHLFKYTLRRHGVDYKFDYQGFRQHPFAIEADDLLTVVTDSSNRFHIMGAINRPTTVGFPTPAPTLADALGAATGLDERRSDPAGVFIFRKASPDTVYTFNLRDPNVIPLIQRFPMQGEDIVYITEAPLVRWNRIISQILPSSVWQISNEVNRTN